MKYKNEAGEEVEAFSQEELDAKLKEEADKLRGEFEGKITEKETAITKLATEKTELENKMKDIKPDHPNFAALKEALDKKDADIGSLRTLIETDKKDRETAEMKGFIDVVAGKNEDLRKKIQYHLDNTVNGMKATTIEERKAKVEAAIKLSVDKNEASILDSIMQNGGGRGFIPPADGAEVANFTEREKSLGAKLGISAEDYKKYASRVTKKN